jgi:hypothetical protein
MSASCGSSSPIPNGCGPASARGQTGSKTAPEKRCAFSKPNGLPPADGSPSEPVRLNPVDKSWSFRSAGHASTGR